MRTAATPFFLRAMGALRYKLSWPLQLAHTTLRLFGQNGLQNHAAATAFYFLLSATPLLLLLSYALQLLGHVAENSIPATILMAALYDQLRLDNLTTIGFIPRQAQLTVGGVGLLTLLLSSRGLVNAVQGAFSVIFPDPKKRNPVLSWVLPLIILPLLLLLMGLAVLAQLTLGFLAQNNFIGAYNAHVLQVLNSLFGFFMMWSLLFAAYWRLPRQSPPARVAAVFALAAVVSLGLSFMLFGSFFKLEHFRTLYGAPGSVVFVLIGAFLEFPAALSVGAGLVRLRQGRHHRAGKTVSRRQRRRRRQARSLCLRRQPPPAGKIRRGASGRPYPDRGRRRLPHLLLPLRRSCHRLQEHPGWPSSPGRTPRRPVVRRNGLSAQRKTHPPRLSPTPRSPYWRCRRRCWKN